MGGSDIIHGGAGNDSLFGGNGNDFLYGETGDDLFVTGDGTDYIFGGDGIDTVDYSTSTVSIWADLDADLLIELDDGTVDRVNDLEVYIGSDFADFILGSNGTAETIFGGAGNDTLQSSDGEADSKSESSRSTVPLSNIY